jgi:tetratricopeptide (TPR) repeat protein
MDSQPANGTIGAGGGLAGSGSQDKRSKLVHAVRQALSKREITEAIRLLAEAPRKLADDPEVLMLRAVALEASQRFDEAFSLAKRSLSVKEHPETLLVLARCARAMGKTDDVERACHRLLQLRPGMVQPKLVLAAAYESAGRFAEAEEVLKPMVEQYEASGEEAPLPLQIEWSKVLVQRKRYDEAVELIDQTLEKKSEMPPAFLSSQFYLRAKALDRSERYDEAADAAGDGNQIGKVDFAPKLYTDQVSALMQNWSGENMATFPLSRCESELPVFVAGMPRSGTSLIDQIIDAHPKASGVGELNSIERFAIELSRSYDPEKPPAKRFGKYDAYRWTRVAEAYVKEVSGMAPPGTERVVNKALGNNKLVGLLARLFPKTRVIHAIRDPRDVAVSCFMGGFNNNMHAWTTQIDWVSHAWQQSMRMMEHWKQTLDIPILDVHYERLVADPENEMPRIIEFLGLEWDDACREFYKSRRTVRTLSYDQVNRPLYTSSSGRHKNYAGLLEGVEFPHYDPFA